MSENFDLRYRPRGTETAEFEAQSPSQAQTSSRAQSSSQSQSAVDGSQTSAGTHPAARLARPQSKTAMLRSFFLGGLLPVIAFTVIEEKWGTVWGLTAGMLFGFAEVFYEWRKNGRVETITLGGNGLIIVFGAVSLIAHDGFWFKLQPAILEAVMGCLLVGSVVLKRPFLVMMARKQGMLPEMPKVAGPHSEFLRADAPRLEGLERVYATLEGALKNLTWRLGIFFWLHTVLAVWAALYASTLVWGLLKGVGFTVSMVLYLVVEILLLRYKFRTG